MYVRKIRLVFELGYPGKMGDAGRAAGRTMCQNRWAGRQPSLLGIDPRRGRGRNSKAPPFKFSRSRRMGTGGDGRWRGGLWWGGPPRLRQYRPGVSLIGNRAVSDVPIRKRSRSAHENRFRRYPILGNVRHGAANRNLMVDVFATANAAQIEKWWLRPAPRRFWE